jgi:hypothetical protein
VFARITQAHPVVDFRNQLTHWYMTVNDTIVWGIGFVTPRFSGASVLIC